VPPLARVRRRPRPPSLRVRLALLTAALTAILSVALGAATYVEVQRYMIEGVRQRLLATAPLVAGALRPGDLQSIDEDAGDGGRLAEHIRQSNALSGSDVTVQVIGGDGQPGPTVGPPGTAAVPTPPVATLRRALAAPFCQTTAPGPTGSGPALACIVAIHTTEEETAPRGAAAAPPGYLLLAAGLGGVDATLYRLRLVLILGVAAITGASLALAPALVRLGLSPLTQMAGAAERIDTADLGRRLPVPPADDEVRNLALSFNRLLDRIEAAFAVERRSEAQARQFAADASHELRSPLTVLAGSIDVLLAGLRQDPAGAERIVLRMQRETQRLIRLVQDLLLLARLDAADAAALPREPVWLKDVVQRAVQQVRPLAGGRSLTLAVEPDAGAAWVAGDDDQLYRILINLLDNAIRHTAEDGRVQASLLTGPGTVTVRVADNGTGIPAEHLPRVFDRFFRADPSRARDTGNAGLGLAIAKRSVELHGGRITVDSRPGEGTCFTITLPALVPAETQPIPSRPR
jgi:heavy metal sensor kinase